MMTTHSFFSRVAFSPVGALCASFSGLPSNTILAYHGVKDTPHPRCISAQSFRDHMMYLHSRGWVVPLEQLLQNLHVRDGQPRVSITFDDAYCNLQEHALPVLHELDLDATLYLPVGHLGGENAWDRDRPEPTLPILSIEALKGIVKSSPNIQFGSHTMTHRRLSDLDEEALREEIEASKKAIEDLFGMPVRSIAYPFGGRSDYDDRAVRLTRRFGYMAGLSTGFGRRNEERDRYELHRIVVWRDDSLERFAAKLEGRYDWLFYKEKAAHCLRKGHIRR